MDTPTKPGIYREMSVEDYDAIPAVRRTFLWNLYNRSPGHAKWMQDNFVATEALSDGTMVHLSVLQPEEFPRQYAVLPPFENDPENRTKQGLEPKNLKSTGYYKEKKAMFTEMCASAGREIVDESKYNMAYELGKRIREHDVTKRFFQRGSANEAVSVWRDVSTDVLCKARYDCLVEEGMPTAVDLKTTADAHPRAFARSIMKWGYYFQAEFYLQGLAANGLHSPNFLIVAGEKSPPYPVVVYECDHKTLKLGALHVAAALKQYKQCMDNNDWPYYSNEICTLQASEWDLKELGDV